MGHRQKVALLLVLPFAVMILPALVLVRRGAALRYDPVAWAQASSCGNAILDPGEECDPPGSITCPPGSPAGAMLPCNADCTCPPAAAPLDHFQCYALKPRSFAPVNVTVTDQFGTLVETLRAPNRLCAPASENGEGISDPTDHLTAYELKPVRNPGFQKRKNQTVVNQFGSQQLDVLRPSWLLVPSGKDGVAQTPPLDHFQCYVIKRSKGGPKFAPRAVTVSSQIETVTLQVVRPFRLCTPADKNGEDPSAPSHPDHLLCYKTRSDHFGDEKHTIQNQFGLRDVELISRNELCVPSLKNPGTTTTTTSTSSTSVTTTSSTSTTMSSSTTTSTTVPTTTTTSSSTTTTVYGSARLAFMRPSRSLLE